MNQPIATKQLFREFLHSAYFGRVMFETYLEIRGVK